MTPVNVKRLFNSLPLAICALSTLIVSGCSTFNNNKNLETGLFIRSEFTWWEARKAFEFKMISDTEAKVITELKPDGKPYNIKIADKAWSNLKNCGNAPQESNKIILNTWKRLDCNYQNADKIAPLNQAITFSPPEAGHYSFVITLDNGLPIKLIISPVN